MRLSLSRTVVLVALACWACLAASPVWAARHALVIGNNDYPGAPLRSAVNDARDLAAALRQRGFEVLLSENVSREAMFQAIRDFGSRLREGDIALFFYAGHAIQLRDRNYLIPVDAKVQQEEDVTYYSLDVVEVLQRMDRARTRANLLILDACRDNPFASSVRLSSVGLAQMSAPPGTLIAYATAPGQVAREGVGRNGVYTKHLLRHMGTPDLPVELVLKRVRDGVIGETRGQQVPWDASSLRNDFVFAGQASPAAPQGAPGLPGAPASGTVDMRLSMEKTFWESIKDSRDAKEFEAYLAQFPDGVFAMLARSRLESLKPAPSRALSSDATATAAPASAPSTAAAAPASSPSTPARLQSASQPGDDTRTSAAAAPAEPSTTAASVPPRTNAPPVVPPVAAAARSTAPGAGRSASPAATSAGTTSVDSPSSPSIAFSDGGVYQGPMLDGSPHGKGRLSSPTVGTYVGEFVRGVRQGHGDQLWPNGDRYVGDFRADRPHGAGEMTFANGDRLSGTFAAGVISGKGTASSTSGFRYEGDFVDGKRQGKGSAVFPDGGRYTGDFRNDKASGNGVIEFADGGRFEGSVVDGVPNGNGRYRFPDGSVYEGEFRAGKMAGMGAHVFPNGDRHEGMFEAGWASGPGVRFFAAGGRFEGVFSEQGRSARGTLFAPGGTRRPGRLENGAFKADDG